MYGLLTGTRERERWKPCHVSAGFQPGCLHARPFSGHRAGEAGAKQNLRLLSLLALQRLQQLLCRSQSGSYCAVNGAVISLTVCGFSSKVERIGDGLRQFGSSVHAANGCVAVRATREWVRLPVMRK